MPDDPTRHVFLPNPVRGDWPIGHNTTALAGVHRAEVNPHGAVAVMATNGSMLGVKPGEFLWCDEDGRFLTQEEMESHA